MEIRLFPPADRPGNMLFLLFFLFFPSHGSGSRSRVTKISQRIRSWHKKCQHLPHSTHQPSLLSAKQQNLDGESTRHNSSPKAHFFSRLRRSRPVSFTANTGRKSAHNAFSMTEDGIGAFAMQKLDLHSAAKSVKQPGRTMV